jgi:hypothetical protein
MPFGPLLAVFVFAMLCLNEGRNKAEEKAKSKDDDKSKDGAKKGRRSYDP